MAQETHWRFRTLTIAAAIGVAVMATITATGASAPAKSSAKPLTSMSFTYGSADDAVGLFKTVGDGMVADGTKLGVKVTRFDNALDGPTALRNAGLMVQDKPTVAIDWNTVVGVGNAVGAQFTKAHIPCLAVNQQIAGCDWFNLSNKDMGLGAAAVIDPVAKSRGWNGKNTTIVMVIAAANGTEVNDGPRYFYVTTAKTLSGFKQVTPAQITAETTTIGGTNGGSRSTARARSTVPTQRRRTSFPEIPKSNNILLYGFR